MPFGMDLYPQVIVFNDKAYIGGRLAPSDKQQQTVIVYDPQKDSYDTLPPYTYKLFSIAVVNNQVVVVGGEDIRTKKRTNQLGVWNEQSKSWTHALPPMTTACTLPSVATHNNRWLVVMGGVSGDGTYLSRVEILDTTGSGQWYQAAPLPQPCYCVSTATIGNMCYLLGGFCGGASYKVFSVQLDELISQAVSQPAGARALQTQSWMTLPDTPLTNSTALVIDGALLAIGGWGSTTIYHYQPNSRSWIKAGELPAKRLCCCCTVLPSGEMLVAGGVCGADRVDIAFIE